jgi:hypothetical protein
MPSGVPFGQQQFPRNVPLATNRPSSTGAPRRPTRFGDIGRLHSVYYYSRWGPQLWVAGRLEIGQSRGLPGSAKTGRGSDGIGSNP